MARRTLRIVAIATGTLLLMVAPLAAQPTAESATMQLNVKNAAVQEVLKLIAEAGNFNIAIGGEVKGSVTLAVDDITPMDLLNLVVGVIDAAYVVENDAVWVMTREAYESRYGEPFVDNLVSRTVVLRQAQVKDVMGSLKSLLGERAILKPDLSSNMITIKASPSQVAESVEMLRALDLPAATRTYELRKMSVEKAAELLGRVTSSQTTIVEDPVGHRLLVSGSDFELNRIDGLIGLLDSGTGLGSAVVPVKYAEPDSLAGVLRAHLAPEVGMIHADRTARRLVIIDHPLVVDTVKDLAEAFDVPRRQVLIEARILQVTTSKEVRSGIDWGIVQDQVNVTGTFPTLADNIGPGLRGDFGDLTSQNYEVIVQALESFGTTELLSSPRLMVVDGGAGHIHVGSQVPYKTIDTRETSAGTINQFEKVVIIEVGVKLEVAVSIQGDDLIALQVRPEVSSVSGYSDDVPVVDNATSESALMIEDGNTVILGGLIKDETRTTRKGVPILASIPLIKYLFSSNVDEKLKSELVILLTPRIMTGREVLVGTDFTPQMQNSSIFTEIGGTQ